MSAKIIRDPLYNYITIDRRDRWLLELLDCPEVQRLRRIHQLGVSHFTYPGAEHNRLSHSLGVVHLMQIAWAHIETFEGTDPQVERAKHPLLAAALLHDVGHGPFSHVFEPCLGIRHEKWSCEIIESADHEVNKVLKKYDIPPEAVTSLIREDDFDRPAWQKSLLSSQLDVDRLDYLRRDSLFTGADYGHFDWYRILNTFSLHQSSEGNRDLVWQEKAIYSIEEYIFARFYMYEHVYFHKTTRGFEKMLCAMWERAKRLRQDGGNVMLERPVQRFWTAKAPSTQDYLAIEEFTVLSQIQRWTAHKDPALADLASRFLSRNRFCMVPAPKAKNPLADNLKDWEYALRRMASKRGFKPASCYVLRDDLTEKLYDTKKRGRGPYVPERESTEQGTINAIRVEAEDKSPVEISKLLRRLRPVTKEPVRRVRYYVPEELRHEAEAMRRKWRSR